MADFFHPPWFAAGTVSSQGADGVLAAFRGVFRGVDIPPPRGASVKVCRGSRQTDERAY
jgi:hypothetical protein